MYRPVHIPRRVIRRRLWAAFITSAVVLATIVVIVARTMPHPPPAEPLTLDQLQMIVPDAAQTQLVAASVRAHLAQPHAAAGGSAAASCSAPKTPHTWDNTQRGNATMIVQVGVALNIPKRGEIVALAVAMQESHLYNLGDLGDYNDHDSLGLFQQRPSMGWGSAAEITDPVYSATAFYLSLKSIPGWQSMSVTDAAQSVQRSGAPDAYAQWETDATVLTQAALCASL
jgi:hypothetical protein